MKPFIEPLMKWYQKNHRELPWRKDTEPYHIWISEIMLQQTRVEAVKFYYERFIKELPTVEALSSVSEERLLKLWEGLGYYSRAKNLQKAAKKIVEEIKYFPSSYEQLLTLPGIGEYTAGAIASIAFRKKVPAVDGNVLRVMMRILNSDRNISNPKTKKELFQELLKIIPNNPGIFNQSLMELGALICIPKNPHCDICPIQKQCIAYQQGRTKILPIKNPKKDKKVEEYTVFVLLNYHSVALHKRSSHGLLASLYEFLNTDQKLSQQEALEYIKQKGYSVLRIQKLNSTKHIFTHKIWYMTNYLVFVEEIEDQNEWVSIEKLEQNYALPTAFLEQLEQVKEIIQ